MMPNPLKKGPLILDIEGTRLTHSDIQRITHPLTAGVILFSRNFVNRAQLLALTQAIRQHNPHLLICVDHEGGRVQRFKTDGFTRLPPLRILGALSEQDALQAYQLAMSCAYILATELRACGVDFSFTPVVDLDYDQSAVIGDRSLHRDPRIVTLLAQAIQSGLALAGMSHCGKHFPGHGFVIADSHIDLPVDTRAFSAIWDNDIVPYRYLIPGLKAVMPAHVIYSDVDRLPAGFSKKWLSLLRYELHFSGAIISDDLAMQAAGEFGNNITERAMLALDAGCDFALLCNQPQLADELLAQLPHDYIDQQRVQQFSYLQTNTSALSWDDLQQEGRYRFAKNLLAENIT